MSIDIVMYRVGQVSEDELKSVHLTDVNELDELDNWSVKAYSEDDVNSKPERFEHIKPFMKKVELRRTRTDYRACFVAHGMPKETTSYSFQSMGHGCTAYFGNQLHHFTRADLDEFTTTTNETYYILKRKYIDVDVINGMARTLMKTLERVVDDGRHNDLSYMSIPLNRENCEVICNKLVQMYDEEALYPTSDLAQFMIEVARAMYATDDDTFIEFQN